MTTSPSNEAPRTAANAETTAQPETVAGAETAGDAGAAVPFPDPALANETEPTPGEVVLINESEAEEAATNEGLAIAAGNGEESSAVAAAAGTSGESADAGTPAPELDDVRLTALLAQHRARLVSLLFAPRAAAADLSLAVAELSAACRQAVPRGLSQPGDRDPLIDLITERRQKFIEHDQVELQAAVVEAERYLSAQQKLTSSLNVLVQHVTTLVQELTAREAGLPPPENPLHPALLNHKKGLEIIQRMIGRASDRRKDLSSERPAGDFEPDQPVIVPPDPAQLEEFVNQFTKSLKAERQSRDRVIVTQRDFAENCRKGLVAQAKSLLPAVDGIDSGLANEPAARELWLAGSDLHADLRSLLEIWFSSYARLRGRLDEFLLESGLEAQSVQPGVPFDPETMEPIGTVGHPDFPEDSVAAVVRRGFVLAGENLRPVAVEVVRNE